MRRATRDNAALAAHCLLSAFRGESASPATYTDGGFVREMVGALNLLEALAELKRLREALTK